MRLLSGGALVPAIGLLLTLLCGCSVINAVSGSASSDCDCGDGICDPVCAQDCGCNADGACDPQVENSSSCPVDCFCNNNTFCEPGEAAGECSNDCGDPGECRLDELCGAIWGVEFSPCLSEVGCGQCSDNLQAPPGVCDGTIDGFLFGESVSGRIDATRVEITLQCFDGPLFATAFWTGARYEGSWSRNDITGTFSVTSPLF